MKTLIVIGNLGSDAEVQRKDGREFLSMSIADTRRVTKADGTETEVTEWISTTYNGKYEKLLPYLKKGQRVYAIGDCSTRLFHSERDHCMKAGLNLYARDITLIGARADEVPSRLYDKDGVEHKVNKAYYTDQQLDTNMLFDRRGTPFNYGTNGLVTPIPQQSSTGQATSGEQSADGDIQSSDNPEQIY